MKKFLPLFVILLLWGLTCAKNPSGPESIQPDAWYLDKQGPVPLYYSREKIVVKIHTDINHFYKTNRYFDVTKTPEPAPNGFYLIYLVPGTNVKWLLSQLNKDPRVEIANPVFIESNSLECIPNNRVSVKFKEEVSRNTIDSLNNLNLVSIVDSFGFGLNWYELRVTKQTGKSLLEITNIYEQSPYTEWAIFDCLIEIEPWPLQALKKE